MSSIDARESIRLGALPVVLTGAITIAYFSFILFVALNKPLMGTVLVPGLSVGLLAAISLLVLCIAVSGVFVATTSGDQE